MSECSDLIGIPYKLGSDGGDGHIDCIHPCYTVWERLGIDSPPFDKQWYELTTRSIGREILRLTSRVSGPRYDGDIVLIPQEQWAFGVVWNQGILYISHYSDAVMWSTPPCFANLHFFRLKSNS